MIKLSEAEDLFYQGQYAQTVSYIEELLKTSGGKFEKYKKCYIFACVSSLLLGNYNKALRYSMLFGDDGLTFLCKAQIAFETEKYNEGYNYYKQLEQLLLNGRESIYLIECLYFALGCFHSLPLKYHNSASAVSYFKNCISAGRHSVAEAAYRIYYYWILNKESSDWGISEKDMRYAEALNYLRLAAKQNYPPAYLLLAIAENNDTHDYNEADKWYEKSALNGNALAMTLYGRFLITTAESIKEKDWKTAYLRKSDGIKWLKESIKSNTLEKDIKNFFETIPRKDIV